MAVYEQAYGPFAGTKTPTWSRFLVLTRYAFMDQFKSKLLTAFLVLCAVYPLVCASLIYLHHNLTALAILGLPIADLIPINGDFFRYYGSWQCALAYFLALLVGPALIADDLSNNGLALYLARPFTRTEYVTGKMLVLVTFLSAITWVPGILLFALQAYLEGFSWFSSNYWILTAIVTGCLLWIVTISLIALAISAFVKWRVAARAAFVAVYIIPPAVAAIINSIFETRWASIIDIRAAMFSIWVSLFRSDARVNVPMLAAIVVTAGVWIVSILLLSRKVRAYEVVR